MKLVILVLFCTFLPVQSTMRFKDGIRLVGEGNPITLICDKPLTKWKIKNKIIADCSQCHLSQCKVHADYKNRITAFCNKENSILHFNSTTLSDDSHFIKCSDSDSRNSFMRIGKYDDYIKSENNAVFALSQKNFTLICDKDGHENLEWFDETYTELKEFEANCDNSYSNYDKKKFNFTCDQIQGITKLIIKNVTIRDDGKIFGCGSMWRNHISVFRLSVKVPVTSVSIQPQSFENEDGKFVCNVKESKPEASFKWVIVYKNGSSNEIPQRLTIISKILKGKLWQTNSTLTLKLKKDYQKIMCKATILNLTWTNSEYHFLHENDKKDPVVPDKKDPVVPDEKDRTDPDKKDPVVPDKTDPVVPDEKDRTVPDEKDPVVPDEKDPVVPDKKDPVIPDENDRAVPDKKDPVVSDEKDRTVPDKTDPVVPDKKDPVVPDEKNRTVPDKKDPVVPDEKIKIDSSVSVRYNRSESSVPNKENPIVSWSIAASAIVILIGGIIYMKCRSISKKKRRSIPANKEQPSEGLEMMDESFYDTIDDKDLDPDPQKIPEVIYETTENNPARSSGHNMLNKSHGSLQHTHISSGNSQGIISLNKSKGPGKKDVIQPQYLEIVNHAPATGPEETDTSGYIIFDRNPKSSDELKYEEVR